MKATVVLAVVSLLASVSHGAMGASWYVSPSPLGSDANPGTQEKPFASIQRGIDAASNWDTVIVSEGTYVENIRFGGKNIILTSTEALDPNLVGKTIIDGNQAGPVVSFEGTENENCILTGFTIRNGESPFGGGICGGTSDDHTRATIEANVIEGNSATKGAGLTFCDGVIQGNMILENSAQWGGGLAFCDGVIRANLIAGNFAELGGGGIAYCNGAIESSTITGNLSEGGGGLYECQGTIQNCIIWANMAWYGIQIHASSVPSYSCIQDWTTGGEGNISGDPRFLDPDGADDNASTYADNDYRLSTGSPCIDKGKNDDWMWEAVDLDGEPRILYGSVSLTVDIGAYEFVPFSPYSVLSVIVGNANDLSEHPPATKITITPIVGSVDSYMFFAYIPIGKYDIHVSAPNFSPEDRSTEVKVDSSTTEVIYLDPNPGFVSGRVISAEDFSSIRGATVQLEIASGVLAGTTYDAVADTDGTFSFTGLPTAIQYQITVWKPGYFRYQQHFPLSAGEAKDFGTISIVPSVNIVRDMEGSFTITWKSASGMLYRVYCCSTLGQWSLAASDIPAAPTGKNSWTDDGSWGTIPPPGNARIRFYRVEAY